MNLKEKILFYRKKAGMSQEALAEKLNVSRQAVSKWETGEATPDLNNLILLAKTFNTTTDHLLYDEQIDEKTQMQQTSAQSKVKEKRIYKQTWADGFIDGVKRIFDRYGWLTGVYVAIIGAITAGMGALAKLLSRLMFTGSVESVEDIVISDAVVDMIDYSAFGDQVVVARPIPGMMPEINVFNPVEIIGTVLIIAGAIMFVGGIILAAVLKRRSTDM